jgi:hypothetical protein
MCEDQEHTTTVKAGGEDGRLQGRAGQGRAGQGSAAQCNFSGGDPATT